MKEFNTSGQTEIWFTEYHTKNTGITFKIKETLYRKKTKYQDLVILDTYEYGKVMILDGLVMLTDRDEFVYHEMITHIPINISPSIENVLIIGGGDCGTLREVSKYKHIKKIKMVEIDGEVVKSSKKFFPQLTKGLSKKAQIIIGDGIDFVNRTNEKFDLIIIDSSDPVGPGEGLFTEKFYKNCHRILSSDGFLTVQAESPYLHKESVKIIYDRMRNVFKDVKPYLAFIPTYPSGMWNFIICSKNNFNIEIKNKNLIKPFEKSLRYYNHGIHYFSFALPNFVKKIYDL